MKELGKDWKQANVVITPHNFPSLQICYEEI